MSRRRRSRLVPLLIAFVAFLLVLEAGVVTYVFVSPSAGDRLQGVSRDISNVWNGADGGPGIRTRVATAAADVYHGWITPLWGGAEPRTTEASFSQCVQCHKMYASQRRFSSTYMNHPLHAQMGVRCVTCHPQNAHPNPPLPSEETCAKCHDVNRRGTCGTCHPPGTLPHFYLLGAPRSAAVQCDTCHPRSTFQDSATTPLVDVGRFVGAGSQRQQCLQCHQQVTCTQCHEPPHPSDWVSTHGQVVNATQNPVVCANCHTDQWCTGRCHANTSTNPTIPQPLPSVGVQP